jgi:hypothetical protein
MQLSHRFRIRALLVGIFLVGLALRLHHLDRFPERNRTADEYAWTWSGMTLVTEGVPRAWSWLPAYPSFPVIQWRENSYRIVRPWLDHPPLYPLYVGSFMRAAGVRDIFAVELFTMRLSTLLLYAAAYFLFFACARRVADEPTALLALAFWAVAPAAVWNGRLVMAEQLMLPLALGGYLALWRWRETRRRRWLVTLALMCALLPLCKAAATAFALWLFTLAVLRRDRAAALAVAGGGAVGLLVYVGYGAHFGWPLFATVLRVQSARFTNFGGFYALVFLQRVVDRAFNYLPFLLGFFTLLADLREQRHVELALFAVVYAIGIAFFLPHNEYGWYLIPLYPALAFGLAAFVMRAGREAAPGAGWIWLLFSGTYLCWLACDTGLGQPRLWRWIYLGAAVALPFVALAAVRAPRRWRALFAFLVALQMCADGWYVLRR